MKNWNKSKTIILSIVVFLLGLAPLLTPDLIAILGLDQDSFAVILTSISSVLFVILRVLGGPEIATPSRIESAKLNV